MSSLIQGQNSKLIFFLFPYFGFNKIYIFIFAPHTAHIYEEQMQRKFG